MEEAARFATEIVRLRDTLTLSISGSGAGVGGAMKYSSGVRHLPYTLIEQILVQLEAATGGSGGQASGKRSTVGSDLKLHLYSYLARVANEQRVLSS